MVTGCEECATCSADALYRFEKGVRVEVVAQARVLCWRVDDGGGGGGGREEERVLTAGLVVKAGGGDDNPAPPLCER